MGRTACGKDLLRGLWRGMNRLKRQDGDLEGANNLRLPLHSVCVCVCVCVSRWVTSNSDTPRTVARQISLSLGFSRQEYGSGSPCPTPGHLPYPGIEPGSLILQTDYVPSELPLKPLSTLCWSPKPGLIEAESFLGGIEQALIWKQRHLVGDV